MLILIIGALVIAVLALAIVTAWRASLVARGVSRDAGGDIRMIDPRELLYSLPTIHDGLPPVDPRAPGEAGSGGILTEDDWRQQELIPAANADYVEATLDALRSHRAVHAVGSGFREIYVRGEPPVPLSGAGVTRDGLARVLGSTDQRLALYFVYPQFKRVAGGFSLQIADGGFLYGHAEEDGRVTALGLGLVGPRPDVVPGPAARVCAHFDLLFVDWLRHVVVTPGDEPGFRAWVERVAAERPDSEP